MIRRIIDFESAMAEWVGEGAQPVPLELAQKRANVCRMCPFNWKGVWVWNMATQLRINAQLELRRTMNIHLEHEDEVKVCDRCGCPLKLKVHVPIKHIAGHTPESTLKKLPDLCWMKQEIKEFYNTPQ